MPASRILALIAVVFFALAALDTHQGSLATWSSCLPGLLLALGLFCSAIGKSTRG